MTTPAGGIEPGPVPSDYSGSTFASCAWMDGWQAGRASTATASPQSRPKLKDISETDPTWVDPPFFLDEPLEHLTERSALQPEAPCEDTEIECPRCSEVFYLTESNSTAVRRPVIGGRE